MRAFHESVAWDGIWIDMSEASCFCAGSCGTGKLSLNPAHPPWPLPGEIGNIIYSYPEGFDVSNSSEYSSASSLSSIQASKNRMLVSSTATAKTATTYLRTTPTPGVRNRDYPPYALNNIHGALPNNAISPSAIHADGASEYSIHSLFGTEILYVGPHPHPKIKRRCTLRLTMTGTQHIMLFCPSFQVNDPSSLAGQHLLAVGLKRAIGEAITSVCSCTWP